MRRADNPLGDFLRARRQRTTPQEAGLRPSSRRRSAGLRREELATLAGVSFPYYTRLEQGHDRHPSPEVVDALGRALRLDEEGLAYLARVAGLTPGTRSVDPETVRPSILAFVEQMPGPAMVFNRYRDVLAANQLAQTLHVAYQPGQNLLRFLFMDPRARERVINWEEIAELALTRLRVDARGQTDGLRLRALIDELAAGSEEFTRLWQSHTVTEPHDLELRFNNPHVGPISVRYERLAIASSPGQALNLIYATPGTPDAAALGRLAQIAAGDTAAGRVGSRVATAGEPGRRGEVDR